MLSGMQHAGSQSRKHISGWHSSKQGKPKGRDEVLPRQARRGQAPQLVQLGLMGGGGAARDVLGAAKDMAMVSSVGERWEGLGTQCSRRSRLQLRACAN